MSNYTQGPWFVHDFSGVEEEEAPSSITVSCTTPDHITVAEMGMGLTGKREEWEANARLIAAAPELLEQVVEIYETIKFGGMIVSFSDEDFERMGGLVAKAKGEI